MADKRGGTAHVVFDDDAWAEDLARTSTDGRSVAEQTRRDYEPERLSIEDLLACQEDSPDGTNLPVCLKVYLPPPAGKFGMVFEIDRQEGKLVLACLAFGVRHHPRDSHAPTVYDIAHERLRDPRGCTPRSSRSTLSETATCALHTSRFRSGSLRWTSPPSALVT